MPNEPLVHVVDDDAAMRDALLVRLGTVGLQARGYRTAEEFLAREEIPSRPASSLTCACRE